MQKTLRRSVPAKRTFTLAANWWEPFNIKLPPGSSDILISKPTAEPVAPPANNRNLPNFALPKKITVGVYTVRVTNLLGQVIQSGVMKDGKLTLNIGHSIPGVYVVSISNSKGVVHVEKVIKQ